MFHFFSNIIDEGPVEKLTRVVVEGISRAVGNQKQPSGGSSDVVRCPSSSHLPVPFVHKGVHQATTPDAGQKACPVGDAKNKGCVTRSPRAADLPRSNSWGQFVAWDHHGDVDSTAKPIQLEVNPLAVARHMKKIRCPSSGALESEEKNWKKWRRDFTRSIFSCGLGCTASYSEVSTPVSRCMHCLEGIPIENVNSHWCVNSRREPTSRRIDGFPAVRRSSSCDLRKHASSIDDVDLEAPPTGGGTAVSDCLSDADKSVSLGGEAEEVDPWSALARDQLLVLDGTGPVMSDPVEACAPSTGRPMFLTRSAFGASGTEPDDESDPWSALARYQQLASTESNGNQSSLTPVLSEYPDRRLPDESSQSSCSVHIRAHTDSVDDALIYCDFGPSPNA